MKSHKQIQSFIALLFGILLLSACDQGEQTSAVTVDPVTSKTETVLELTGPAPTLHVQSDSQITIGNKRYLYDISEHSIEELQSLLQRAEEITQTGAENLEDLEIVMILHGPDIGWFTLDSYDDNKELVDLAKRLDAFDIIDLKVCETTMEYMEIDRNQLPPFIESVPYAPDEFNRLSDEGYTHL
jgi:intracellular sulfur oxidation DsrE/DsrF family protein